jgi:hypothetical protein
MTQIVVANVKKVGQLLLFVHPFGEFEDEASKNSCELSRFQRASRTFRHAKPYRYRSWNPHRGSFRWARINDAPVIATHRNSCCDCECNTIRALQTCLEGPLTGDSAADTLSPVFFK